MGIRRFNDPNTGRWAPVLTHVNAVIGADGKNLKKILEELDAKKTIASISESLSDDDGGVNVYTINYTDGTSTTIHTKNGTKGATGLYDPQGEDTPLYTLETTKGQSDTSAMTQKAVTDILNEHEDTMEEQGNYIDDIIDKAMSVNLFDKTKATLGKFVKAGTDGQLGSKSSHFATDYIPITSAGLYCDLAVANSNPNSFRHAVYDANKTFIRETKSKTTTYQEGDAYVRYTGLVDDIDAFMVVAGGSSNYPATYVRYGYIASVNTDAGELKELKDEVVGLNKRFEDQVVFEFDDSVSEGNRNNSKSFFDDSNLNIPTGSVLRFEVTGMGTVMDSWVYRINDGDTVSVSSESLEIEVTEPITKLYVYTLNSLLVNSNDQTGIVTMSCVAAGSVSLMEERIDSLEENNLAVNKYILSGNIASYSGTRRAKPPLISKYVFISKGSTIRLTFEGIGGAVSRIRYQFNGDSSTRVEVTQDGVYTLTPDFEIKHIKVWTTGGYYIQDHEDDEISVSVDVVSTLDYLTERVETLETSNVGIINFDTNYVLEQATDPDNFEFEDSFYFSVTPKVSVNMNVIVSSFAKFINETDDEVPTIQFRYLKGANEIYKSPAYIIGCKDEYIQKEWRIPRFFEGTVLNVNVVIPKNVTLYIKEISNRYSNEMTRQSIGYRMNAHIDLFEGGFNSMRAFVESAKLGYPCCICVPKRTSDGVWVCFHHDNHIENALKDDNGNTPADNYSGTIGNNGLYISDLTYEKLQTYHYKTASFDGVYEKVPTLEDFFAVCAKTGMHPMFSWHPIPSEEYMRNEIRPMAEKFGLLPYLNIKIPFSDSSNSETYMNRLYRVFGNDIESYTADFNSTDTISDIIERLDATDAGQNNDKVRVGIELFNSLINDNNSSEDSEEEEEESESVNEGVDESIYTDTTKVDAIREAGYFAAIAWMTHNPSGKLLEYWIKNGVTEFTEYKMMSYGLNW